MGIVVRFQARTSAAGLNRNTDIEATSPRRASSPEKIVKYSGGMTPLDSQLLTAEAPTPATSAVADGPPKACTTSSTDKSMRLDTSQFMKLSSLHHLGIDFSAGHAFDSAMPTSREQIIFRLNLLPGVLGKQKNELARIAGVEPSDWSNYISPKMTTIITWQAAAGLREAFGITLDWIFCGDFTSIQNESRRLQLLEAAQEARKAPEIPKKAQPQRRRRV